MRIEIETNLTQLAAGTRLPAEATCTQCDHTFSAGDRCTIQAIRSEDAPTYTLTRLSCPECAPQTISSPALGHCEHLLTARLTTISTLESLTLSELQVSQTSAPSEGSANTDGPITLLPTADLPELTTTTYHIERDDEQGAPLCNCSPDSEYARIAFADLETDSARCCQTCLTVYQNGHETHPPIIRDPHHAQTRTTDLPSSDPVNTTQRATSPITPTSVQAQTHSQE